MIQGYATPPSVFPGESISICVASGDEITNFRAYFFRRGANWEFQAVSDIWTAYAIPKPEGDDATTNWGWPSSDFTIPDDWASGAYVAVFVEGEDEPVDSGSVDPDDPNYFYPRTLFVVKSAAPGESAGILYKVPLFTYCAYDFEGFVSLYTGQSKVTMQRVGASGLGGDPYDKDVSDAYDLTSPRQTFSHWDAPFISWLESNGYQADYCTDLDIHENADDFLQNYSLLLSVGHDEYWSEEMRTNVEDFVSNGGNVAFFSANTCWWRIHLTEMNTAFTCDKTVHSGNTQPYDQWMRTQPETALTGVSYKHAGGWWSDERDPVGFTVQYPDHWVYAGTALAMGEFVGNGTNEALVGYECDGARIAGQDSQGNYLASHSDGTPSTFVILGVGQLGPSWEDRQGGNCAAATMGLWGDAGIVFTAATTDWARVLAAGNPNVDRITRNVLEHLDSMAVQIAGPFISGLGGGSIAVEGKEATFTVGTGLLGDVKNRRFKWTINNKEGQVSNQPTFTAQMPSPPVPVTIAVSITCNATYPAFGTLTFKPLKAEEYGQWELTRALRRLLAVIARNPKAAEGSRDQSVFTGPLWDRLRGEVTTRYSRPDLKNIVQAAENVVKLGRELLDRKGRTQSPV